MIRTGRLLNGAAHKATPTKLSKPGGPVVLFEPGQCERNSQCITLDKNECATICAFGLCGDDRIEVWKVKMDEGEMPSSCGQCIPTKMPELEEPGVCYAKPLMDCGECVVITEGCSDLTLEGPGEFQLRAWSDQMLCRAYVEYTKASTCCPV